MARNYAHAAATQLLLILAALVPMPLTGHAQEETASASVEEASVPAEQELPIKGDQLQARYDEARALFERGVEAANAKQWADAQTAFLESSALVERPNTLFNLSLAAAELGDHVQGYRALVRYLEITEASAQATDEPSADVNDRMHAQELLNQMRSQVALLSLTLRPESATLTLDGGNPPKEAPPWPLSPGEHTLYVSAEDYEPLEQSVSLEPGTKTMLNLTLTPLSPSPAILPAAVAPTASMPSKPVPKIPATSMPKKQDSNGLLQNPWFWATSAVVIIAGGVVTALLLLHKDSPPQPYAGSSGVLL